MKKELLAIACLLGMASTAQALDITGNGAVVSQYIFRGIPQSDNNTAVQGGLNLTESGFYLSTWGSTVDDGDSDTSDGLEIDYYGGYNGQVGDFNYGAGVNWYTYTDDFDEEYLELSLTGGWKFLTVNAVFGEYDTDPDQDYQFYSLTANYNNFSATYGFFEDDFDGYYIQGGYSNTFTLEGKTLFNYSLTAIYSSDDLLSNGEDDINFVASISKSFKLFSN